MPLQIALVAFSFVRWNEKKPFLCMLYCVYFILYKIGYILMHFKCKTLSQNNNKNKKKHIYSMRTDTNLKPYTQQQIYLSFIFSTFFFFVTLLLLWNKYYKYHFNEKKYRNKCWGENCYSRKVAMAWLYYFVLVINLYVVYMIVFCFFFVVFSLLIVITIIIFHKFCRLFTQNTFEHLSMSFI